MTQFEQIIKTPSIWDNVPTALNNVSQRITRNIHYGYSTRSRTLSSALSETVSYWFSRTNPYATLSTLCSLMLNEQPINIQTYYRGISSEEAEDLTLGTIINEIPRPINNAISITICHIATGKSYLKKLLDEDATLNRIKPIEMLCTENIYHFVRIYKGFGNSNINDITIFTDHPTKKLIQTIYVMLPNLLGIDPLTVTENEALTPEGEMYNKRVFALRKVFAYLYEYHKIDNDYTLIPDDISEISITLKSMLEEFTNLFDFVTTQINTFTANLAKARNTNATKYFNSELNNIKSAITTLESQLTDKYARKSVIERQLIACKTLNDEDVKPFIDTINSSKAIEIIETTDMTMLLKVTAPLQYFTESDFEAYEKNPNSTYNSVFRNSDIMKKILHKIFVTREYKLIVQGIIHLKILEGYYDSPMEMYVTTHSLRNYTEFPNPHLYHYNCWEKARTEMNKNICEGNFELVVMQMIAAVQSVNIAENASFVNGLLSDIRRSEITDNYFHIIAEDGKTYDYKQIIAHEQTLQNKEKIKEAKETIENAPKGEYTQVVLPEEDWVPDENNNENEDNDDYDYDFDEVDNDDNEDTEENNNEEELGF